MLTNSQYNTLRTAIIADQTANAFRLAQDTASLLAWCNALTATNCWKPSVTGDNLFDNLTISSYDNLSAGKRDAWNMLMNRGSVDATKAAIRNGIKDIFTVTGSYTDAAQLASMLNGACIEFGTKAQIVIGGSTPSAVGGVSALKRNFMDLVTQDEANRLVN